MTASLILRTDFLQSVEAYLHRFTGGGYTLWKVCLELAVIGVVVYATLRFLQGTRGARLMRAIGLIVITSFLVVRLVAQRLELDRINHLYPFFLGAVFLIALVVFQTELRRGLLRLGADWWSRAWAPEAERRIEPIVRAVANLSKKKVGALIAVERGVGVAGVAESGVRLDAVLSAELLESIFWPGSTLHDMGTIVRQGKIVAASCQFPLAESGDVDRSLGSRHRAAVGMSADSDALVIVVSEETGTISVAEHGRLRRSLTPDGLRDLLLNESSPSRKRGPSRPQRGSPTRKTPEPALTKVDPTPSTVASPPNATLAESKASG